MPKPPQQHSYYNAPLERERSTRRKTVGIILILFILSVDLYFSYFVLSYFSSNANVLNPTPKYKLDIPISFNFYYSNTSTDYSGTPNFEMTIWITGTTPVKDTILAGQPFTMGFSAFESNYTSPLNQTRLISIFFEDTLNSPATNNTETFQPNSGVVNACENGACICNTTQSYNSCAIPTYLVNSTSRNFWSNKNETFYFPISGTYSPIIRFVAIGPNNRTTLLVTAYRPQLGDISLQVQPASFAQEATIGNATVILSVAILVFGIVESAEGISKIVRFFILKEKLGKLRQSN